MTVQHRILDIQLNQIGRLLRISFISLNYYPPDIQLTWQMPSADINITKHECMYMRQITDWIFSQCISGSGGLLIRYSFCVWIGQADYWADNHLPYAGVGGLLTKYSLCYERVRRITDQLVIHGMQGLNGLPTEYSIGVCRGQADYWSVSHSWYARVRWPCRGQADYQPIFIWCMNRLGRLPTKHSLGVWMDQANCWLNIDWYMQGSGGLPTNIHSVYEVRRIIDRIFIRCMVGSGELPTEYSLGYAGVRRIADQIFIWYMDGSGGLPTKY